MGRYYNQGRQVNTSLPGGDGAKRIYFNPGCCQWTVPSGVTCATFELWGGGGSGSPSCCCTCYGGESGYGGAYAMKTIAVTPGTTYTICVGPGGCGRQCWFDSTGAGTAGAKSYVTGTGLSNLCAEGGPGGRWCGSISGSNIQQVAQAYGGDINVCGGPGFKVGCYWYGSSGFHYSGFSPFGGGRQIAPGGVGSVSWTGGCGMTGVFPGGGSTARSQFTAGWCDCCALCTAGGADGLVIITL